MGAGNKFESPARVTRAVTAEPHLHSETHMDLLGPGVELT